MSEVKVNKISPRTACGTVTLGDSGDTFTVPSGVTITNNGTQTGFGRTGTVDWVTTPKVTGDSPVTAATGSGYFLDTTAGTITINLPAGAAGSIVSMADYAGTWDSNNVTITPNGSEKIGGTSTNVILDTEGQSVTLVYVDSTQGWLNVQDSTSNVRGALFVTATGGTPCSGAIVCTDYKVHTFTGPGTLTVSCVGNAVGSNTVDYLVVAGGGGGGSYRTSPAPDAGRGAGGGAGGYRESSGVASGCYTVSPRGTGPGTTALAVPSPSYPITVGGGAADGIKVQGSPSTFSTITSTGGGGGGIGNTGGAPSANKDGGAGGSGGGAATWSGAGSPGPGNNPPVTPDQGTNGGTATEASPAYGAGGGGGAICAGGGGTSAVGGDGGDGATSSITATPTARAGGGGGATQAAIPTSGAAGSGGGGVGGAITCAVAGTNAGCNTGGGGGGGGAPMDGGNGGDGVVIIRYKFQ